VFCDSRSSAAITHSLTGSMMPPVFVLNGIARPLVVIKVNDDGHRATLQRNHDRHGRTITSNTTATPAAIPPNQNGASGLTRSQSRPATTLLASVVTPEAM